MSNIACC